MNNEMREKWIDNAKGIAILLVIIGHVSTSLEGLWNFGFVYGIHLVMFFLLSGYTLKKKELTREFINQKFSRLMRPYFYTCFAIILTDIFNSYHQNHDGSIETITHIIGRDLLRSFFASGSYKTFGTIDLGMRIGAIWFLPAMFFAIMIFQLLLQHIADDRFLGIFCGMIALAGYLTAKFLWLPFSIQSSMMACFFLWIGYEIKKKNLLHCLKWHHYFIAQFLLLFGIYNGYCNVGFVKADIADLFLSIPVGLAGCLLIYLISKTGWGGVFENIGKISLTILCTHLYALETMGKSFNNLLNMIGLKGNCRVWSSIFLEVFFALSAAWLIEAMKKIVLPINKILCEKIRKRGNGIYKERDTAIDVAKGIFVISMIIGHFNINSMLRSMIYSCHMVAFVFFSGYFYKKSSNIRKTFRHMLHTFIIPYVIFVIGDLLMNYQNIDVIYIKNTLVKYSLGISFARKIFSEVPSIGPVYFILMLFIVRLIYLFVDHYIKPERYKLSTVIALSIGGMLLGKKGFWLP